MRRRRVAPTYTLAAAAVGLAIQDGASMQSHLSTSVRPYLRLSDTCRQAERRARLLQLLLHLKLLLLTIGGCIAAWRPARRSCARRTKMVADCGRWTNWTQGRRPASCRQLANAQQTLLITGKWLH